MRRFLQKLRKKPKSTRRKIAFGTSASITGVIFAVWLTVMLAGGGVGMTAGSTNQNQAASPLGALGANAGSALTEAREQLSSSNTDSSSSATTSTENTQESGSQHSKQTVDSQPFWESDDVGENPEGSVGNTSNQQRTESDKEAADNEPYWEGNDSGSDDSAENTPPPSQVGKDFWRDSGEDGAGDGWF